MNITVERMFFLCKTSFLDKFKDFLFELDLSTYILAGNASNEKISTWNRIQIRNFTLDTKM